MTLLIDILISVFVVAVPLCLWLFFKNTTTINPEAYRRVSLKIDDDGDHLATWG